MCWLTPIRGCHNFCNDAIRADGLSHEVSILRRRRFFVFTLARQSRQLQMTHER